MKKEFIKYKLPKNWVWTTIGEIGIVQSGGTPSTKNKEFWGGEIAWITPADLSGYNDKFISRGKRNITQAGLDYSSAKLLPKGSICFSSRAPIGYTVIAKNELATNQGFKNLIPTKSLSSEYVYYYFKTLKSKAEKVASGTTFLELSATKFSQLPFPLPPLTEQKKIVSKLEALFSELDQAEKGLHKAKQQLKIYKHALLKYAFEGKLTEQWRNEHNPKSSEELLKHINIERKKKYEQEIVDWKKVYSRWNKEGKMGKKPRKPFLKKLMPLSKSINVNNWFMSSFVSTVRNFDGDRIALSKNVREFRKGKYPYYGATEIVDYVDDFIFDGKYILIGEDGANLLSKTKKLAFIASGKFWVNNHAHVVQPLVGIRIEYLTYYFNSLTLNEYVTGTAQPKLTQTNLNRIPIPYCSNDEQEKIVEILESCYTLVENMEKSIDNCLNDSTVLRHSILKKAFDGKLINQDSNDESAEELLLEIKAEMESYLKAQKELDKLKPKKKRQMETKKTVLEILKETNTPISTQELWTNSVHNGDIESFYEEIKEIHNRLIEVKEKTESLLSLKR